MKQRDSMGEFVKQLAARLHEQNVSMPFKNERPWHILFYRLKTDHPIGSTKPAFFDHLRFDWDGPYPKSRELSEFLQALHWNASVSANNPHYDVITVPAEVAALWRSRTAASSENAAFVECAAQTAQAIFSQQDGGVEPANAACEAA